MQPVSRLPTGPAPHDVRPRHAYDARVALTALLVMAVMGVVIEWWRRLPRPGDTWAALSPGRRLLAVLGAPVGLLAALFAAGLVAAAPAERTFYEWLLLLVAVLLGIGGLALGGLTVRSLLLLRR